VYGTAVGELGGMLPLKVLAGSRGSFSAGQMRILGLPTSFDITMKYPKVPRLLL
jgi:hypothetical protein